MSEVEPRARRNSSPGSPTHERSYRADSPRGDADGSGSGRAYADPRDRDDRRAPPPPPRRGGDDDDVDERRHRHHHQHHGHRDDDRGGRPYDRGYDRRRSPSPPPDRYRHGYRSPPRGYRDDRRGPYRDYRGPPPRGYRDDRGPPPRGRSRSRSPDPDAEWHRELLRVREQRKAEEEKLDPSQRADIEFDRASRSVVLAHINPRAREKDLYDWFTQRVGPVADLQIINDRTSRQQRRLAYVELVDREYVPKALMMNASSFMGQAILVQAAKADRSGANGPRIESGTKDLPRKIFVSSVHALVDESDLSDLFSPFGRVDKIEIVRPADAEGEFGHAFVTMRIPWDAKSAVRLVNNANLGGVLVKTALVSDDPDVNWIDDPVPFDIYAAPWNEAGTTSTSGSSGHHRGTTSVVTAAELMSALGGRAPPSGADYAALEERRQALESAAAANEANVSLADMDSSGGMRLTGNSRALLMQRLQRAAEAGASATAAAAAARPGQPAQVMVPVLQSGAPLAPIESQPTECVQLTHMFDRGDTDPSLLREIEDDVGNECSKFGRVLRVVAMPGTDGHVYVQLDSILSAKSAAQNLHGRFFAGERIVASYVEIDKMP